MASRKQAVKNAVPKPGLNYFLSHRQDRAIDEGGLYLVVVHEGLL